MKLITYILLSVMLCSCYHKITRVGYVESAAADNDCKVEIVKFMQVNDTATTKLGEIKLGDTGFSTKCNENDAMNILHHEACSLNADLINIIEETPRSFTGSSCYRCAAVFYKSKINQKKLFDSTQVKQAASIELENKKHNEIIRKNGAAGFLGYFVGYTAGAVLGYYLGHLLFSSIN